MILFVTLIFFGLGLIIGSFLNVVIYRYNTAQTFGGRSACMSCQSKLHWYDLVPVFSFVALSGRCRTCKTKLSFQYPLVELATGVFFAILFSKFQNLFFVDILSFSITYGYYVILFSLLLVIAVYDLKHKIIPDTLALFFGVLSFIGIFFFEGNGINLHYPGITGLFSGLILALPFALLWLVSSGRWMGLGDAKLMVGIGYLLGLSRGLAAVMIAFWIGAFVGILLLLLAKRGMKSELPFAPFLVLGTMISFMMNLGFILGF